MNFRDWLWDKYLDFSKPTGRVRAKSQAEFARYLGISPVNLSRYLNGDQTPEYGSVAKLANMLGNEVYSIAGFDVPAQSGDILSWLSEKPTDDLLAISELMDEWKRSIRDKGIEIGSDESKAIFKELAAKSNL